MRSTPRRTSCNGASSRGSATAASSIGDSVKQNFTPFLIPVGGPLRETGRGRVLLAGDAGGFVNGVTAEGIYYGMVSGELAARAILETGHGVKDLVRRYRRACDYEIGAELRDSVRIQRYLFADRRRIAQVISGANREPTITRLILDFAMGRRTYRDMRRRCSRAHAVARGPAHLGTVAGKNRCRGQPTVTSICARRLSGHGENCGSPGRASAAARRVRRSAGRARRLPRDVDRRGGRLARSTTTASPTMSTARSAQPGYVGTTVSGVFSPQSNITHARQRWLFRMVHTNRPLQEKMTLFWHNHFATGYNKIAGALGAAEGARYMAAKPSEDPGQRARARSRCCATTRSATSATSCSTIAKDTAMLVWLDGRTNTKAKPQENFGREIMELFTMGVGNYTEADVYAAARVFTGWNLQRVRRATATPTQHYEFVYNADQHDTDREDVQLSRSIPTAARPFRRARRPAGCRTASISSTASPRIRTPARYLAAKLYRFFVSEFGAINVTFVNRIAIVYLQSGYDMKAVMREVLLSPRVLGRERLLRALLVAGRIRRPRVEGRRLDRLLGRTTR